MATRNVRLEAILRSDNTPLSDKTIVFKYRQSGTPTWTDAGSAKTGQDGKASVTVSLTTPGNYDFRAEFAGDNEYEASSAEVTNYRVKGKTTITLTVSPQ